MKNFKNALLGLMIIAVLFTGCSTINLQSDLRYPISMTNEISSQYNIVGHFKVEQKAFFTIGGLITFKDVEFDQLVNAEVQRYRGDGAINVKMKDQQNATDILINVGLSVGGSLIGYAATGDTNSLMGSLLPFFLSTRTVVIEGDVIKKIQ